MRAENKTQFVSERERVRESLASDIRDLAARVLQTFCDWPEAGMPRGYAADKKMRAEWLTGDAETLAKGIMISLGASRERIIKGDSLVGELSKLSGKYMGLRLSKENLADKVKDVLMDLLLESPDVKEEIARRGQRRDKIDHALPVSKVSRAKALALRAATEQLSSAPHRPSKQPKKSPDKDLVFVGVPEFFSIATREKDEGDLRKKKKL